MSGITSYTGNGKLEASGAGSVLSLPNLTSLTGGVDPAFTNGTVPSISVMALAAGTVSLPKLTQIGGGPVNLVADGTSSLLNLSALASCSVDHTDVSPGGASADTLQATNGGTIKDGALTNVDSTNVVLDGTGTFSYAQITSFTSSGITIPTGTFNFSSLTDADASGFTVNSGATLNLPIATSANSASFTVGGGTLSLPALTSANGASFVVSGGGSVSVSGITSYTGNGKLEASGAGSVLSLPNLTSLNGGVDPAFTNGTVPSIYVMALAEGTVALPKLTQIGGGPVFLEADGTSSLLNLSALASCSVNPNDVNVQGASADTLQATNGGILKLTSGSLDLAQTNVTVTPESGLQVGTLIVDTGSTLTGSGILTGNLIDSGSVALAGQLTITGTYTETSGGVLGFVLSGVQAGTNFGELTVNGSATLGGTLSTSLSGGFTPALGNAFAVMSFASSVGYFTSYSGLSMPGNLELDPSLAATGLTLTTNNLVNIALTTSAQSLVPNQVSQLITLQLQDQGGNPTQAGAGGLIITLSTTSSGGTFLNASGHPLPLSALTVPAGASTISFEYEDKYGGAPVLTAQAPSGSTQTQQESVAGPFAESASASLNEDSSVTIDLAATDTSSAPITYAIVSGPSHGSLTFVSNGVYTYTPATYYNGPDSFTFDANDGTYTSNVATISIAVAAIHVPPVATPQTVTLPDSGQTAITLQGFSPQIPASQLVYTVTSLPSSGTLVDQNGAPVTVGETFVGNAAVLTFTLPTEFLGSLSTSLTFTATDNGFPAGSNANDFTSTPATVTIQTPSNSTGVLRIGAGGRGCVHDLPDRLLAARRAQRVDPRNQYPDRFADRGGALWTVGQRLV